MIGARTARVSALAAWSAFFFAIWLGGDAARYLGARTLWVVPFGAFATGVGALAVLLRPSANAPLTRSEGYGLVALLTPILAVVAFPHAELGAAAAARRAPDSATVVRMARRHPVQKAKAEDNSTGMTPISYTHIMAANIHPKDSGVNPGMRVRLIGFAMRRPGTPAGLFEVTRFYIACCIADALPLYVTVDPPGAVPRTDQWVIVDGPLARRKGVLIVQADRVTKIPPPARPYLDPWGASATAPTRHGTRPPKTTNDPNSRLMIP
jgi:uncharacterized repeat protein (TIGR03943 family)